MKVKKILKYCGIICLSILVVMLSFILIFVCNCISEVKDIDVSLTGATGEYCRIYNSDGLEINSNNISNTYVTIDKIPQCVIDAFVSIEDKDFYKHDGINYKRMLSAMVQNISSLSFSQGASTITQQLVKNKFLTNEKTLSRKIKEIYLAKKMEHAVTKDEILEEYLNSIYYGSGAYGIGNACYRYFGKNIEDLNLNEGCVLAGVINSPSRYSPISNLENSKARRNIVLKAMLQDGKINLNEYEKEVKNDLDLDVQKISGLSDLDLYSQNVLYEASKILNMNCNEILHKGYKIYTYQDATIQEELNNVIQDSRYYVENEYGNIADSLSIILDNSNAGVVAVSGKSDYNLLNIKRQPGSLVKPVLVYAPALEEKIIYPCSELYDEKMVIDNYSPRNIGNKYYGYVSIDDCIAKSLNTTAVQLCNTMGVKKCKEYGKLAGLEFSDNDNGLAIALGGMENGFTIQNIAESYLPFSNNGNAKNSRYISKIISPNKITLYTDKITINNYCSPQTAHFMTKSLKNAVENGTSKKLSNLQYDIAGKTGTVCVKDSNLNTDAYSLAYTSRHTMCVWLGNYTMKEEYNLVGNNNGGTYATEMIRDTFDIIYSNNPPENFLKPNGICEKYIDTIELKNNHNIMLAGDIPYRYQRLEEFSIDNVPAESNYDYSCCDIDFDLIDRKSYIDIKFSPKEYNNYFVYRIDESGNKQLVDKVSNCGSEMVLSDKKIKYNQKYKYYILCKTINGKEIVSPYKYIVLEKDYTQSIGNVDKLSWIFT